MNITPDLDKIAIEYMELAIKHKATIYHAKEHCEVFFNTFLRKVVNNL